MTLVALQSQQTRNALKRPGALATEAFVLVLVAAVLGAMLAMGREMAAPQRERVPIDLSLTALPNYAVLSLTRAFLAYALSLAFTLVAGTVAAHSARAEKFMLPAFDVLQAIPVLGFLPGLVLAMVALCPTRELGLEIAAVLMMFTAQVWNMVFSFHARLRGIPREMREVAAVQRLSGGQTFKLLELPSAMIGLVWNSMMSMAGGWFFLTVNEAFTLAGRDYRLPGVGSYMHEAIVRGDAKAMAAAVVAMVVMIVGVDRLLWRPLVVWSQRFTLEQSAGGCQPRSWVLGMLERSRLLGHVWKICPRPTFPSPGLPGLLQRPLRRGLRWAVLGTLALAAGWGAWSLLRLIRQLPLHDAVTHQGWSTVLRALGASFLRTSAAVLLAAGWALPAGIALGRSQTWTRRVQPLVQVLASFPAPMLFPLVTMLLAALRVPFTLGCVVLMLLGSQWYVLFNVMAGATTIPTDLAEVAAVCGVGRWRRWTRLYVPCVFPHLVTGLITAAGAAWNATIVAEAVEFRGRTFTAFGLGSMITQATACGNFPLLAASTLVLAIAVVVINRSFWKRLYRIAEQRYSLEAGS